MLDVLLTLNGLCATFRPNDDMRNSSLSPSTPVTYVNHSKKHDTVNDPAITNGAQNET